MLEYLVTSKVRRRLLQLMWGAEQASGTATILASLANVSFASAYRELNAMRDAGLAASTDVDGFEVFFANQTHPVARAVRDLVSPPRQHDRDGDGVRAELLTLGAPL